jgi:hypothetical protein
LIPLHRHAPILTSLPVNGKDSLPFCAI